jgi:C1A family cysteine protease
MFRLTVVLAVLAVAAANLKPREYYEEKFFNWVKEHAMEAASGTHFVKMLQNFANNDDIIETHNSGNSTFTLGHNQFSHMSQDEWRDFIKRGGLTRPEQKAEFTHQAPADVSTLATSIDWEAKGAVTPVKDQGQCGSCWSFSTTGALEGAYEIKYGSLKSFSEQNLVDCDNRKNGGTDMGCNGGLMDNAFKWVQKNGGICYEQDYPYVSGTTKTAGTCNQSSCTKDAKVAPKSYTDVQKNSDSALMSALNQQPVSVAIEADQSAFQLYKSGVFTAACGTNLDHGVLAVGYGTMNGQDYYKVKNSWGASWGDKGYIYLAPGVSQSGGQCGILMGPPSYPNL